MYEYIPDIPDLFDQNWAHHIPTIVREKIILKHKRV